MPSCYLLMLSLAIVVIITSVFIRYYLQNIHNKETIPDPFIEIDVNTLKEIESNLIKDYQRLESEVQAYNKSNDYIKQESQFIALIEETLAQERVFKEKESQLKSEPIKETFDQNDLIEIQAIIKDTLAPRD